MSLGAKIRMARKGLRMTQKALAGDDFSPALVSQLERDQITPSLASLRVIATRLRRPVSYFLEEEITNRELELDLLISLSGVYLARKEYADSLNTLDRAITGAQEIGDAWRLLAAKKAAAQVYFACHEYDQSITFYLECRRAYEQLDAWHEAASCAFSIGVIHQCRSDPRQAIAAYEEALVLVDRAPNPDTMLRLRILGNLGGCLCRLGQYERGITLHEEAMALAKRVDDFQRIAQNYLWMGLAHRDRGDLRNALDYTRRSLDIFNSLDSIRYVADTHTNLGIILAEQGDWEKAYPHLVESLRLQRQVENPRGECHALSEVAAYYLLHDRVAKAEDHASRALHIAVQIGDQFEIARCRQVLGGIRSKQGQHEAAVEELTQGLRVIEALDAPARTARFHHDLAEEYTHLGRPSEARAHYEAAVELYKQAAVKGGGSGEEDLRLVAGGGPLPGGACPSGA
ncbi:MAG: helix-turn-helix transcriptional regulator [Bacillota bacterium]